MTKEKKIWANILSSTIKLNLQTGWPLRSIFLYQYLLTTTTYFQLLLVFSVTPLRKDQNKNQNHVKRWREKKEGKYAKTLLNIQVTTIFLMQDMRRNFYPNCGWKPTETSVTEFCYKSVNLSPGELKNIKIILFLIQELFKQLNSPK